MCNCLFEIGKPKVIFWHCLSDCISKPTNNSSNKKKNSKPVAFSPFRNFKLFGVRFTKMDDGDDIVCKIVHLNMSAGCLRALFSFAILAPSLALMISVLLCSLNALAHSHTQTHTLTDAGTDMIRIDKEK